MTGEDRKSAGGVSGFGLTMALIGLLLFGISFAAANDAEHPKCDGQSMSGTDTCRAPRSGAQSRDDRASDAATAAGWLRPTGIVLLAGGLIVLAGRAATAASRRAESTDQKS
ncbi:hypothetical protein [Nocardia tengchongensis]|uniref:hypothetical protein n=1 Tax=Nocardia tengchongensis TaxID=2055889 RepID=UPI0036B93F0B